MDSLINETFSRGVFSLINETFSRLIAGPSSLDPGALAAVTVCAHTAVRWPPTRGGGTRRPGHSPTLVSAASQDMVASKRPCGARTATLSSASAAHPSTSGTRRWTRPRPSSSGARQASPPNRPRPPRSRGQNSTTAWPPSGARARPHRRPLRF